MPRMLDLIRTSQVPLHLMQSAARGALSVPPEEMIEILVYLALHHKLFGPQARLTLAGWDEKASLAAAADPTTSAEVLGYFVALENLRTCLLPALAENPAVGEEALDGVAVTGSRPVVEALLTSTRVLHSPRLLQALQTNANLRPNELAGIGSKLAAVEAVPAPEVPEADAPDEVIEGTVIKYLEENAAELAAEKNKPFQPIGMALEEAGGESGDAALARASADAAKSGAGKPAAAAVAAHAKKHPVAPHEERRDSVLQKIAKLDI